MQEKLDPALRELVDHPDVRETPTVDVLVAVDAPMDPDVLRDLAERGLTVRSDTGTVLTGSIGVDDVSRLADSDHVVKIEASAPMFTEPADDEVRASPTAGIEE